MDALSFFSGRWNIGTNPDLVFASVDLNSSELDRRTLEKFPKSQHRLSLIAASKNLAPVPSEPHKRWNFRKTNWELYGLITNHLSQELPSPDSSSIDEPNQDFRNTIFATAKLLIPRGRRSNYGPCRDAECEHFYQVFLQAPQGEGTSSAVSTLLNHLDEKRKDCWSERSITSTSRTPVGWHGI